MRRLIRAALSLMVWLGVALPACAAPPPDPAAPFADWAAVVVAGDWHASSGRPSEAFDNARRDVGAALRSAGFQPQNLRELSARPARYRPRPAHSDIDSVYAALSELAGRTQGGCLAYITSHGQPQGVVVDDDLLEPSVLGAMLDDACGGRPTVVVISACFSGVFVPELAAPNRMVLTAARADRTSFGCGESDRYPYFDDCFLRAFPAAHDFRQLGAAVQSCVARREKETGMAPPSEPQLSIGPALRPLLPLYALPATNAGAAQF
ncbi:peptidase C13 [Phenylobacterium sp. LjRoot219]|uniref:C13 family peptidase n=1 Tax=Phenylobacterium sp. LjRoot219 TaxID=3342283 RepID=UPI003ED14525